MRSEHRAPLIASIIVVLACGGVMAHAIRTDALGGFARLPFHAVASRLVQPKPTPVEAPQPVAAPRLAPAVPPAPAAHRPNHATHAPHAALGGHAAPAPAQPAQPAHPAQHVGHAPAATTAPPAAPAAPVTPAATVPVVPVAVVPVPVVPVTVLPAPAVPSAPPFRGPGTTPGGHVWPGPAHPVGQLLGHLNGRGQHRGQGPKDPTVPVPTVPAPAVPAPTVPVPVPSTSTGTGLVGLLGDLSGTGPGYGHGPRESRGSHHGGGGWR